MVRASLLIALVASSVAGCGSRCQDVKDARDALTQRQGTPDRGADVEVAIPMDAANKVIAELLAQKPLTVPIEAPDLGPLEISTTLTATVRSLQIVPGDPGRVRFAVVVDIDDPAQQVTAIDAVAEIEPELKRGDGEAQLVFGIGPQNVLKLEPQLSKDAQVKLGSAVTRWIPDRVKAKLPSAVVDLAAGQLGKHLTGAAWTVLQKTLFVKLGELTSVKLRLPDVPVAKVDVRSDSTTLVVQIRADLPVRQGIAGTGRDRDAGTFGVTISGSAAAEMANWAIDSGRAPEWYTRSLKPDPDGSFRPRFDYVAGTSHPVKVYAFQERGGCSYFAVGAAVAVKMAGEKLQVTATDRELDAQSANPAIEAAAWLKFFLTGWVDRSKKVAAHTQLTIGGRVLGAQVTSAALVHDELVFGLALDGNPREAALDGSGTSRPSAGSTRSR